MVTPPTLPIPSGAGFGIRVLARMIDLAYGTAIGLAVGITMGIMFTVLANAGSVAPDWLQRSQQTGALSFGLSILGAFLYQAVAEGIGAVTVGKLICGLRVVQRDGRPATMKGAFIRDLAYHVDALFFGLIGYASMNKGPLRQRYGDVWGETVVVKTSVYKPHPNRGPGRIFAGIFMGSCIWAALLTGGMVLKVI